jgi:hypothetical protein
MMKKTVGCSKHLVKNKKTNPIAITREIKRKNK